MLRRFLAVSAAAVLLAGCPTKPVDEKEPGTDVEDRTGTAGAAGTAGLPGRGGYTAADLNDPSSPLYQRVIYFEYDQSDIQPQFVDVLRAHASYLSSNTGAGVTLEGHTDERGTREYNLALGDQRADTVRRFLLAEGVADGQINTLSYGQEKPANPAHTEAAWALNRRVHLVY
ncbi:MAG: peptidoglycan-associated lipoprotein Pal [Pseudomonadota bacterium]|nr:peptidoglycan-associated lipoprotein Pal [Pseudomonadota bacterium]